jgi:transcriptional regulator with XRE-family HTH domain
LQHSPKYEQFTGYLGNLLKLKNMDAVKEKVITNIKTIRETKNYSEEYMADKMGISQSTYNRKENGEGDFTLTELINVAGVLEVSVSKIIELDLAKIINQTNNDHSTGMGIVEHLHNDEGYKVAVAALEKEVEFLRGQVKDFMAMLAGKI